MKKVLFTISLALGILFGAAQQLLADSPLPVPTGPPIARLTTLTDSPLPVPTGPPIARLTTFADSPLPVPTGPPIA